MKQDNLFHLKVTDSLAAFIQSNMHQADLEGLEKKALAMAEELALMQGENIS